MRKARFAQRIQLRAKDFEPHPPTIPTSRERLRNPGIARQSTDSYFAQHNPRIARLPDLRGTYTYCLMV